MEAPTLGLKPSHSYTYLPMKMEQSVPKRRHIKFRHRGITRKKAYKKCELTYTFIEVSDPATRMSTR